MQSFLRSDVRFDPYSKCCLVWFAHSMSMNAKLKGGECEGFRKYSVSLRNLGLVIEVSSLLVHRIGAGSVLRGPLRSGVAKERHEAKVHVVLDMAVKQRKAGLVCDQVYCHASEG